MARCWFAAGVLRESHSLPRYGTDYNATGSFMSIVRKLKRALRGEVEPKTIVREALRRARSKRQISKERASLDSINIEMPKLWLSAKDPEAQLKHFQTRVEPHFLPGANPTSLASLQIEFPEDTEALFKTAGQIVTDHSWPLLGF